MADRKIKVLVISDHPLSPSGVGSQTKYMIESCLKTDKFSFVCLGGAMIINLLELSRMEKILLYFRSTDMVITI